MPNRNFGVLLHHKNNAWASAIRQIAILCKLVYKAEPTLVSKTNIIINYLIKK